MSQGLTAADRLVLLAARDVIVTLTPAGQLDVQGPEIIVLAAAPMLRMCKADIVQELERQSRMMS